MNREKIIQLASDAGFDIDGPKKYHDKWEVVDSGNRWITDKVGDLCRAAQREAFELAAKECDLRFSYYNRGACESYEAENCAAAIREMAKEILK